MLYVRKPGDDNETCLQYPDDDPFFSEISNFINRVENEQADSAKILSSYDGKYITFYHFVTNFNCPSDAVRTYEFTWAIRRASETKRQTT